MAPVARMLRVTEAIEAARAAGPGGLIAAAAADTPLGPASLDEVVGQDSAKRRIRLAIRRAVDTGQPMPHLMLYGPPGSGKSTIAGLVAAELGVPMVERTRPLRSADELTEITYQLGGRGVLFLDEVHQLPKNGGPVGHALMAFMEKRKIPGVPNATHEITVIGATTEPQDIFPPLMSRFTMRPGCGFDWEDYTPLQMRMIVSGMADRAGVMLDATAIEMIANAACGVPREARDMVIAARDLQHGGETPTAEEILDLVGIDPDGLKATHRDMLLYLHDLGPQSQETLCTLMRVSRAELKRIEEQLIRQGYITISGKGRKLLPAGRIRIRPEVEARTWA